MDGGMNVTFKGYIVTWYIRTHIHLIELHADFFFSMASQVSLYLPIKRNEVRLIKIKHTASTQTEKQTDLTSFYYHIPKLCESVDAYNPFLSPEN